MQKLAVPAALIVGAILGFFGKSLVSPTPETDSPQAKELTQLRSDNAALIAKLDNKPKPSKLPSAILPSDSDGVTTITEGPVTITSSTKGPKSINLDFSSLSKQMAEQQKKQDGRKIALELAQLKSRLGLTPEQEEQVRELLGARAEGQRGGMANLMSMIGKEDELSQPEDLAAMLGGSTDGFSKDLTALLSDDQRAAYDGYLTEKRTNEIEATASRDLAQLQSMFPLSEAQKDQAFEAFTTLAADSNTGSGQEFGIQRMMASREERLSALEPILTPEQMEVYENSPQMGNTMVFGGDGGSFGGASVISTISVDMTADGPIVIDATAEE